MLSWHWIRNIILLFSFWTCILIDVLRVMFMVKIFLLFLLFLLFLFLILLLNDRAGGSRTRLVINKSKRWIPNGWLWSAALRIFGEFCWRGQRQQRQTDHSSHKPLHVEHRISHLLRLNRRKSPNADRTGFLESSSSFASGLVQVRLTACTEHCYGGGHTTRNARRGLDAFWSAPQVKAPKEDTTAPPRTITK